MEELRLNIGGAGGPELPGYRVVDVKTGDEAFPLKIGGEAVADNSVDAIYASHVLEHFSHRITADVLREWVRVLKPNGLLQIAVPDFDRTIAARAAGDTKWRYYLMGGHIDDEDFHGAVFDEWSLRKMMRAAGLRHLRRWQSGIDDCAALPVSLNIQGIKFGASTHEDFARTRAAISVPRLGFTAFHRCASSVLAPMGIPIDWGEGAYWEKAITWVIEAIINAGAEYVLTLDYDTVFNHAMVEDLHWLMKTTPQADAICAVQMQRGRNRALACVVDEQTGETRQNVTLGDFEPELTRLLTGHFGLTLFRTSAFAKLAKPWFKSHPDFEGNWSNTSTDADIVFWQQFAAAGCKLYQANHVVAGHAELMVTWPDRQFHTIHQYPDQFNLNGPPANARW